MHARFLRALFPEHAQLPNDVTRRHPPRERATRHESYWRRSEYRISHLRTSFYGSTINVMCDSLDDPDYGVAHNLRDMSDAHGFGFGFGSPAVGRLH